MTVSLPTTAYRASLPEARGSLSGFLLGHLRRPVHRLPPAPAPVDDQLGGDDAQLALYLCYELHYQGLTGIDEDWEWEPTLLAFRHGLEARFLAELRVVASPHPADGHEAEVGLRQIVAAANGPSLSAYMAERGTLTQMREFAVHRSAWQLKEADAHTWGIPRLSGRAKAAMVKIQSDEYGDGVESNMHSVLFAETMSALDLDPTYGAYLDLLPGVTLATTNLVSLFGLRRRWRGALIGHLATFEMTSVKPMSRYSAALARLGAPERARRFYDAHVQADAHHAVVAGTDLVGGLATQEPTLVGDILFGARSLIALEDRFTERLLASWSKDLSSLLCPLP